MLAKISWPVGFSSIFASSKASVDNLSDYCGRGVGGKLG